MSKKQHTPEAHMQEVTEAFIKEIHEKGLSHLLRWIDVWYSRAARAEILDDLEPNLTRFENQEEARELALLDRLLPDAESSLNFSTSQGHNLFKFALISERAQMLNSLHPQGTATPCSRSGRRDRWDEVLRKGDTAE